MTTNETPFPAPVPPPPAKSPRFTRKSKIIGGAIVALLVVIGIAAAGTPPEDDAASETTAADTTTVETVAESTAAPETTARKTGIHAADTCTGSDETFVDDDNDGWGECVTVDPLLAWFTGNEFTLLDFTDKMAESSTAIGDAAGANDVVGLLAACADFADYLDQITQSDVMEGAPTDWTLAIAMYSSAMDACVSGDLEGASGLMVAGTDSIEALTEQINGLTD